MSHWNYRICKQRIHFTIGGRRRQETVYSIREVFYGPPGTGWTDPVNIDGLSNPMEVIKTLGMMLEAKNRPVLWVGEQTLKRPITRERFKKIMKKVK